MRGKTRVVINTKFIHHFVDPNLRGRDFLQKRGSNVKRGY